MKKMSWGATTSSTLTMMMMTTKTRTSERSKLACLGRAAGVSVLFLLLPGGLSAQNVEAPPPPPPPPPASTVLDSVAALALETPPLQAMAAGLIDSIGGRLSGTSAGIRAESWAGKWLREIGFDSVWTEPVRMRVWRRGQLTVQVVQPAARSGRRIAALAYGYSPPIDLAAVPVLDIGRGDLSLLAAAGAAARGAALLTDVINPELIDEAVKAGAAALMRISFEPGRLPQARVAPTSPPPAPLPLIALSNEDGSWLRRLSLAGQAVLRLHSSASTITGAAANVVGELRGSDPALGREVVILGAHLDAWDMGDGALDNGTGVLAVLAAARAIVMTGVRPRRTVRVVFFAGEELGLLGSQAYVTAHQSSLGDFAAMLNMDMVGAPEGFGATGHAEADTLFARLAQTPLLKSLGLSTEVDHGGGPGSDHQPFLLAGVPTVYVRTSLPPDAIRWYHNAGDTFDKVDFEAVKAAAAAAAALAWALADEPGRPLVHLSPQETRQLVQRLGWMN